MSSASPPGDPVPPDGSLPGAALATLGERPLGIYLHVPFCAVRCGYCDFNTYTALELGASGSSAGATVSQASYAAVAAQEVDLAARVLGGRSGPVETVFVGGGTPTLLPAADLVGLLARIRDAFGLVDGAEVTTEANPDSVDRDSLRRLRDGGFTRISLGMQSSQPHVLATLDRTHDPERVPQAVAWAREAGFDGVSLDLIYGTPGESLTDWRASVDTALACEPDHVSAYALIVEEGTALARAVRRGKIAAPDDDSMADKYVVVDEALGAAGLQWYELSNWARGTAQRCRHNELYWTGADWWGIGPGAHSHVGGVRWWNVRHPAAYAARLAADASPGQARELLDAETRRVERVLLETRLVDGLPLDVLDAGGRAALSGLRERGLLDDDSGAVVLTQRGRLLADAVVRDLLPD